jgi:ribonuclease HII
LLQFERQAWDAGHRRVAGVDEAGRGPLAGPVVAAAVVIEADFLRANERERFAKLTDSKQLTAHQRDFFFDLLTGSPQVEVGVGMADAAEIDEKNILNATHLAMARAVARLVPLPEHLLVDGLFVPGLPCSSTPIVDGDAKSLLIAAASVIAKVTRDRLMRDLDRQYPEYGFAEHKGYGTKAHAQALLEHGPTPIHRRTFRPVRDIARIRSWIESNGQSGFKPAL